MFDVEYELKGWVEFFSKRSPFMCAIIEELIAEEPTLDGVTHLALYYKKMKELYEGEVEEGYYWSAQVFLDMMFKHLCNEDFSIYEYMKKVQI